MIKKFYKWYMGNNRTYPEFLDGIQRPKMRNNLKPEELITQDEVNSLIKASSNARDRALFSTLYDSGVRIGELLTMRIKDLAFDEYGAILKVNGKTGYSKVRIVGNSIAYLRGRLDNHPQRNNPEAWLSCGITADTMERQLMYPDVYSIIRRTVKRAGIKRRINPHFFRHTRAALLASRVGEAPLEAQMGWAHGSKMSQTYVHLSMRDQDRAILKAYGIDLKEERNIEKEQPLKCPRCGEPNDKVNRFCWKCGMILDKTLTEKKLMEEMKEIE
ncbi:MAG: tyrosine-type recombinase/integrase [Candidatus Micrarchaeaceae archaeon]